MTTIAGKPRRVAVPTPQRTGKIAKLARSSGFSEKELLEAMLKQYPSRLALAAALGVTLQTLSKAFGRWGIRPVIQYREVR